MGDNDAMSKAIELEQKERVECPSCGWSGPRRNLYYTGACPRCFWDHVRDAYDVMVIDVRAHPQIRAQVSAGLAALRVQGRQIWGEKRHTLPEIAVRLMVGVGDVARLARDHGSLPPGYGHGDVVNKELKKELGNLIFSTIRFVDDLGLDVLECIDLAVDAQEKFVKSGRPR